MMGEWRERVNRENERVTVNLLKENARREKDERLDSQQTASIHYLHRHGAYIKDFESIMILDTLRIRPERYDPDRARGRSASGEARDMATWAWRRQGRR